MSRLIAQISVNPSPPPEAPSGQITLNPNLIGGVGGIGVMIWAAVQVILKTWESKESSKTKTQVLRSEARIEQDEQALSTLVEVFRKGQEANYDLQAKSFESTSQLMAQMMAIKAQSTEQLAENLLARMEAYDKNQLAIHDAFRQNNIAIADLAELIKKVDWRGDTSTQEIRQYFQAFEESIKRIHMRIDNAVERTN